jgi:hypothetical protein
MKGSERELSIMKSNSSSTLNRYPAKMIQEKTEDLQKCKYTISETCWWCKSRERESRSGIPLSAFQVYVSFVRPWFFGLVNVASIYLNKRL